MISAALLASVVCLVVAQDPGWSLEDLRDDDPARVELARRALCLTRPELLDPGELAQMLDEEAAVAAAAASVLAHHRIGDEARRGLLARAEPALQLAALDLASLDQLEARLDHPDPSLRIGAMYALEGHDALEDSHVVALVGDLDDAVAEAALRLVLYERSPFPAAMLTQLADRGRVRMVEALSSRPRAASAPWLLQLLRRTSLDERSRLLAISALPNDAIDERLAREVLQAATKPELRVAAQWASLRFTPRVADSLVGAVHAAFQDGVPIDLLLSCLGNASELGERQVLSLSRVLSDESIEHICHWLAARGSQGLAEHIVAALDRDGPIEPHLLRRAAPHMVTPARVQRVVDVLRTGEPELQTLGFYALVQAVVYRKEMLDYATHTDVDLGGESWSDRARRLAALLSLPRELLPDDFVRRLLDDPDEHVCTAAARKLAAAGIGAEEGRALLRLSGSGPSGMAAGRALALRGDQGLVQQMWDAATLPFRLSVLEWLLERPQEWTEAMMRSAMIAAENETDPDARAELQRHLLRGLAALGDERSVDRLLEMVPEMPPGFVHRCADALIRGMRERHMSIMRRHAMSASLPEGVREEIVRWIAERTDLPVEPILSELYESTESEEIRFVALSGLVQGERAAEFHEHLREAMARPLSDVDHELAYYVLGSAPTPLRRIDLLTMARLLLVAPLADPRREALDALDAFPRASDYPMHIPVIDRLRRDRQVDRSAFDEVISELENHQSQHAVSGRRLAHILSEMAHFPRQRSHLAPTFARMTVRAPELEDRYAGIAELILGEEAEALQKWELAARHHESAARILLRRPLPPLVQRAVLGDSSVPDGLSAEAALAARTHVCRARALAERDAAAAMRELLVARDLGEGDRATEQEVADLMKRIEK